MQSSIEEKALGYHEAPRPGKTEVVPTKGHCTAEELALAYSPGVSAAVAAIGREQWNAYRYTNKGNLVGVISNGSAVLGLGNVGAEASKPVMEGKSMLFKIYADIDAFDIEIGEEQPEKFIEAVRGMAPTFGAINLEDIKSPDSFYIEQRLRNLLDIPVLHDDQHGTAVVIVAGLLNAAEIAGKEFCNLRVVINGAGAAGISTARALACNGLPKEHITMFDSKGAINTLRTSLSPEKRAFATSHTHISTLTQSLDGADVFIGLSKGNVLTPKDITGMADNPIIFALANPIPEIDYATACRRRPDAIVATGRSDTPNQINNVLAFPYLFRGVLDTLSTCITGDITKAASQALANLAHSTAPQEVKKAYNSDLHFGREYILPKPNDRRLLTEVSKAVAQAAIASGVARRKISDWDNYCNTLLSRIERERHFCREIFKENKKRPLRRKYSISMPIF